MMQDVVVKLLEINDYKIIGSIQEVGIFTYQSELLKDVVIVAPYSTGDLNSFEESDITRLIMDQFDHACSVNPNALKDTSLIICHRVEGSIELEEVKNTILKVEENEYGFRKYVLSFSRDSIQSIESMDKTELSTELPKRLQEGFSAYAESPASSEVSEYGTILRIYSKLPFLNYEKDDNNWSSLDIFLQEKLDEYTVTRKLVKKYNFSSNYEVTIDEEIDELLSSDDIQDFLEFRKDN